LKRFFVVFLSFFLLTTEVFSKNDSDIIDRWADTQIYISSLVGHQFEFFRSVTLFRGRGQFLIDQNQYYKVESNSTGDINGYSVIHILGDLNDKISVDGQNEIIIAGSVSEKGMILAEGINKIFIGGDFSGQIESADSLELYIKGSFQGFLKGGIPTTNIVIEGNYKGVIDPTDKEQGGMLYIDVKGSAKKEDLDSICKSPFTQVYAVANVSSMKSGIYDCDNEKHRLTVR